MGRVLFFAGSQRTAEPENGHIHFGIPGHCGAGIVQRKNGGSRCADDEMGRSAGTGTIGVGREIHPGFQVCRSVIAGCDLHIIRRGEQPGYLVGDQVVARLQPDVLRVGQGDVAGGIRN